MTLDIHQFLSRDLFWCQKWASSIGKKRYFNAILKLVLHRSDASVSQALSSNQSRISLMFIGPQCLRCCDATIVEPALLGQLRSIWCYECFEAFDWSVNKILFSDWLIKSFNKFCWKMDRTLGIVLSPFIGLGIYHVLLTIFVCNWENGRNKSTFLFRPFFRQLAFSCNIDRNREVL